MPGRDELVAVVHEWTIKAENDLKTASHTLKFALTTIASSGWSAASS